MFYFYYTHFAPTIQKNSGVPKKTMQSHTNLKIT